MCIVDREPVTVRVAGRDGVHQRDRSDPSLLNHIFLAGRTVLCVRTDGAPQEPVPLDLNLVGFWIRLYSMGNIFKRVLSQ